MTAIQHTAMTAVAHDYTPEECDTQPQPPARAAAQRLPHEPNRPERQQPREIGPGPWADKSVARLSGNRPMGLVPCAFPAPTDRQTTWLGEQTDRPGPPSRRARRRRTVT
eukprot:scaffold1459_cov104-Isochrysis_galbana.AAC.6